MLCSDHILEFQVVPVPRHHRVVKRIDLVKSQLLVEMELHIVVDTLDVKTTFNFVHMLNLISEISIGISLKLITYFHHVDFFIFDLEKIMVQICEDLTMNFPSSHDVLFWLFSLEVKLDRVSLEFEVTTLLA